MSHPTINESVLKKLTKLMFHECYSGNLTPWFDHLHKNSIYIGNGDPILIGKNAITTHFKNYAGLTKRAILQDSYFYHPLSDNVVQVYGKFIIGHEGDDYYVISRFSLTFVIINDYPYIMQQQNSYEYIQSVQDSKSQIIHLNSETLHFIRKILDKIPVEKKIQIKNGRQEINFIDPSALLYIQGNGKHSELYCIDQIISCSQMLSELKTKLPDYFYPVHRSFIVNTKYITNISRFKVTLITGTTLPIPEHNYKKVKEDLLKMI